MQQASALLTPGRTNPSLRGQTRRLPGKTKWAAARLTTRANPKDARRVSRLTPHASVGAGADTSPSDDTHDDKTAFTILARNSPGVLQVRRRVTHFKRPKYLRGKSHADRPPPRPRHRPYRPRSPTPVSTSAPSTPPRTRSTPHCPTSRWSSRLSAAPSSRWTLWTFPRRGEFIFHIHMGN